MKPSLTYAAITPARNESENLPRLASCLQSQTIRPTVWLIAENGSTDGTQETVRQFGAAHRWIRLEPVAPAEFVERGAPIVRAFHSALALLGVRPDIVVKLDADVSMETDYFERLLEAFEADPKLGIASGTLLELRNGRWRQHHGTRTSVWGAARAYRWRCLQDVLPLEERMGWDGIDELKANVYGWRTATLLDLPLRHHRMEGQRDGSRWRAWQKQGGVAHFMGYRISYLVLKSLFRMAREPAAIAILWGYARSVVAREPRFADADVRGYLRRKQRLRELPLRACEALGRPHHSSR
jgi:biofilm PGA synthesis N-glycosyltransferase PgaC